MFLRSYCTIFACIYLFLTGCTPQLTAKPSNTSEQLPSWVTQPPRDDSNYLYGIGQGKELDKAKGAALADIAGKLLIAVSSETESHSVLDSRIVRDHFQSSVATQVKEMQLGHYEVMEVKPYGGQLWILIRLNRVELVRGIEKQLKDHDQQLHQYVDMLQSYSGLERYLALPELSDKLQKSEADALLLSSADSSFVDTHNLCGLNIFI